MTYLLHENWGGRLHDAKKTDVNTDDDRMCWAAAASNVLAWTKWCFPEGRPFNDETEIFNYFQGHWEDKSGYPNQAWEWWFNGTDYSNVNVPGGGFWKAPEYSFEAYNYQSNDRTKALSAIDNFLNNGYGVVLDLVSQNSPGHCITCWGYEQSDDGEYLGIYTTDSDDTSEGLRYYEVTQDISGQDEWARYIGWWYFTYHKNSTRFLLSNVYALDRCPTPDIPSAPSAPKNLKII